jgi:hypothetical protein
MRQVIDWCPPLATEIALTDLIAGGYLDRHLRRSRAVYRERYRLLWAALGRLLPVGYQLLPAQAGLHVAVVRPNLPADRQVWSLLASRGMQVGSLRRTYHFTDPAAGFLLASEEFLPHRSCLLAGSLPNRWRKLRKLTVTAACARTAVEWSCIELQMAWRVAI